METLIFLFLKKGNNLFLARLEYPNSNIFNLNLNYFNLLIFILPKSNRASISTFFSFINFII